MIQHREPLENSFGPSKQLFKAAVGANFVRTPGTSKCAVFLLGVHNSGVLSHLKNRVLLMSGNGAPIAIHHSDVFREEIGTCPSLGAKGALLLLSAP